MIKETVKYIDYNGVEREDTLYFHFNKAEIAMMQMSVEGGMSERIQKIIDAKDQQEIIKLFKKLVLDSYGIKSEDGKRFEKSEQLRTEFEQSEAYSELFMTLATNTDEAIKFVNGILPQIDNK